MKNVALLSIACLLAAPLAAQDIRITSLLTTNEFHDSTYDLRKPIVLDYRQTHIVVNFRDPGDAARATYSCRLLGLENNWRFNGRGESVTYVNLFGGDYELRVKNLNYPNRVASLKFHLEEAFWQKDWFVPMLVAYGLLLVGVVLYFVRIYRLRGQLRLQEVRNEIAADLHDDVGSTLGNISFLTEMAKMKYAKDPAAVLPILETILSDSQEMIQTLRGMVWTINPDNDRAADFVEKIRAFADSMLGSRRIELRFKNELSSERTLSVEQQRGLFLILKELIHNCAKHSAATQATLTFKEHEGWLWVRMTDNGRGFDSNLAADGNGLRNLEKRIATLAGKLGTGNGGGEGRRRETDGTVLTRNSKNSLFPAGARCWKFGNLFT